MEPIGYVWHERFCSEHRHFHNLDEDSQWRIRERVHRE
jgi:hypothetical protein